MPVTSSSTRLKDCGNAQPQARAHTRLGPDMNQLRLFPVLETRASHSYGRSHTLKAIPLKRELGKHMQMPSTLPKDLCKNFSEEEVEEEAKRLFDAIGQSSRWNMRICRSISPLTLEINQLKKLKDVFLIAHSYQTPDIVYGVADSVSDSYTLSKAARDAPQETILFSS